MPRRCLRVGENGKRCGLAVAGVRHLELQVLVLPKLWAETCGGSPRAVVSVQGTGGAQRVVLSVVATELQTVEINELEKLICADQSVAKLSGTQQQVYIDDLHNCIEVVCGNAYNESKKGSDGSKGWRRSSLVKVVESVDPDALASISEAGFRGAWESFVSLRMRAVEAGSADEHSRFLSKQLGCSSGQVTRSGLLQPLLHALFVECVRQRCGNIRPGYSRVRGVTSFVKGQLDCVTTAVLLAAGRCRCVCTYDQLSLDTPLNRIIVAALDVVRAGWDDRLGGLDGELQQQAAWLGRVFQTVPRISRHSAIRGGRALRNTLGRLDREWREAARLACLVLECARVDPGGAVSDGVFNWRGKDQWSFVYDLETNYLWEELVRQFFGLTHRPDAKEAWLDLGNAKPADGFIKASGIVLDAKYREQPVTPAPEHQHQIFAYSYMYNASLALLIYAAKAGATKAWSKNGPWQRLDGRCFLDALSVTFPSSADVRTKAAWSRFIKERRCQASRRLRHVELRVCRRRLQMLKKI